MTPYEIRLPGTLGAPTLDYVCGEQIDFAWLPDHGWDSLGKAYAETMGVGDVAGVTCWTVLFTLALQAGIGRTRPRFVEIGAQFGDSTVPLCLAAQRCNGYVWSIDCDATLEPAIRDRLDALGLLQYWMFRPAPSQTLSPLSDIDFLLVDGDHNYEAVVDDLTRWGTAVRPGGFILLDDYHLKFPGKMRWIQERWSEIDPIIVGPYAIIRPPSDSKALMGSRISADAVAGGWLWKLAQT